MSEHRLRRDASRILSAALAAVDPARLVSRALRREAGDAGFLVDVASQERPLRVVAVGKAAVGMVRGAVAVLQDSPPPPIPRRVEGLVLAPEGSLPGADHNGDPGLPSGFRMLLGGHPLPTDGGLKASREIIELLESSGPDDPILFLLSGGGSALLALPADGISLSDLRSATQLLLEAGATIHEVNAVRKHLERTKGGLLARAAYPAPVLALVISDVIGDRLDSIASGPLAPDRTSFANALEILHRYDLSSRVPAPVLARLTEGGHGEWPETPGPDDPCFSTISTRLIGNVRTAVDGAIAAAADLGYEGILLGTTLSGEARLAGRRLGAIARALRDSPARSNPICLVAGGETTVTVAGGGRGGRNQEVALGAALELDGVEGILVASFGTDGVDGPTDAAGALATGTTLERARNAGLDAQQALRENDSYPFFGKLGDLIMTGPTGTNVMDVQVTLIR